MKRVLGVDGALPGAVRQKCATCNRFHTNTTKKYKNENKKDEQPERNELA
jgi:hypothetical protein